MAAEIIVSDIRLVINRIFDHIENDLNISRISLDEDSYWEVSEIERYNFSKTPEMFEHGQMFDDLEFLSSIVKDKDQAVSYMLVHVAPILRYMAEKIGQ